MRGYMYVCTYVRNVDVKRKAQWLASPYTRSLWLTTNDANASMYLHKRFVCNGVQSTARKIWTMLQSDVWTWHTSDRGLIIYRYNVQFRYQSAHRRHCNRVFKPISTNQSIFAMSNGSIVKDNEIECSSSLYICIVDLFQRALFVQRLAKISY